MDSYSDQRARRVEWKRTVKQALVKCMLPKLQVGKPVPITARRLSKLAKVSEAAARTYLREVLKAEGVVVERQHGSSSPAVVVGLREKGQGGDEAGRS